MWDFAKEAWQGLLVILASWLSYDAGKNAGRVQRAENAIKQANQGKVIDETIDAASAAELDELWRETTR